jgi:ABC-type phosphate transport system substrate-binding protein
VKNNPGSIGFVVLQTASKYTGSNATQVTVDGIVPTAINAASGAYSYYGEAYAVKDSSLTANAGSNAIATAILNDLASRVQLPTSASAPSLVAVPSSTNTAVSPPALGTGGTPPIAVGTTGGNSCTPFTTNRL